MTRRWHLRISTFKGLVGQAIHYYAHLTDAEGKDWEVTYRVTAAEADTLNTWDDHASYKPGDLSSRSQSRERIIEAAIARFEAHHENSDILLMGNPAIADPVQILAGPPDKMMPLGDHSRIHSKDRVGGWISEYTRSSRMRRAMSCVYWEPKSRIRIRSCFIKQPLINGP